MQLKILNISTRRNRIRGIACGIIHKSSADTLFESLNDLTEVLITQPDNKVPSSYRYTLAKNINKKLITSRLWHNSCKLQAADSHNLMNLLLAYNTGISSIDPSPTRKNEENKLMSNLFKTRYTFNRHSSYLPSKWKLYPNQRIVEKITNEDWLTLMLSGVGIITDTMTQATQTPDKLNATQDFIEEKLVSANLVLTRLFSVNDDPANGDLKEYLKSLHTVKNNNNESYKTIRAYLKLKLKLNQEAITTIDSILRELDTEMQAAAEGSALTVEPDELADTQAALAAEKLAHAETQKELAQKQAALAAEKLAHAETQKELTTEALAHTTAHADLAAEKSAHADTRVRLAHNESGHAETQKELAQKQAALAATQEELAQKQAALAAERAKNHVVQTALLTDSFGVQSPPPAVALLSNSFGSDSDSDSDSDSEQDTGRNSRSGSLSNSFSRDNADATSTPIMGEGR